MRLQVAPEALLCYADFQRAVLCGAGVVYRYVGSEGRPPLAADESWRAVTAAMLRATPAPAASNPN